jgi:hypothetical protein
MNTIYRFEFVLQMVRTKGLQSLHPRPSKTLVSLPLLPAAAAAPPPRDTIGAATSAAVGSTPIMAPISNPNPLALGPRAEMGRRHVSRWRSRGRKKTSLKSLEVDRLRIPCRLLIPLWKIYPVVLQGCPHEEGRAKAESTCAGAVGCAKHFLVLGQQALC